MKKLSGVLLVLIFLVAAISAQTTSSDNLVFKEDYPASQINNLKFNLTFENLITEEFYGEEITIEIQCNNSKKTPVVTINKDTLEIKSTKQRYTKGDLCTICIYFPKNFSVSSINISNNKGNISLKNLDASNDIKISTSSSDILVSNTNTSFLNLKSDTGNITATSQVLDYFDIQTNSGKITLELFDQPYAKSHLQSVSGKINLSLPRFSDFDVYVNSKTGVFWDLINGTHEPANRTLHKKYNEGGASIIIESTSSDIFLKSN